MDTMRKYFVFLILLFSISWTYAQENTNPNGYNIFYYPNGQKSSEGHLVNGKPDGWWKSYNMQGVLISEGNRKNFELDSLWIFYDDQGKKTLEITYTEGRKNGRRVQYFENEFMIENWRTDTIIGIVKTYYSDSLLKKATPYVEGLAHGLEKEFDRDGLVTAVTNFYRGVMTRREFINRTDLFGYKQGKWKFFWENGNLQLEGSFQNDKKHGFFKYYDEEGNFYRVEKYEYDQLIEDAPEVKEMEIRTAYHPNGQPSITATYYKGVPEGMRREYDTAGNVIKGYIYVDGIMRFEGITDLEGRRQGLWKEYYETGELRSEGHYINSNMTGKWRYFFPNQKIEIVGNYNRKGQKNGEWQWFYPNGELLSLEYYEDGKLEGEYIEYDEHGNEIAKGNYIFGEKDGDWNYLHGSMKEEGSYYDGARQGIWKLWYGDGTLASEIMYEQDLPDGKYTLYWENGNVKLAGRYADGVRNGVWNRYNEEGTLTLTTLYKEGVEVRWNNYKIK